MIIKAPPKIWNPSFKIARSTVVLIFSCWPLKSIFRVIKVDFKSSIISFLMNIMNKILELKSTGGILSAHTIEKCIAGTL